MKKQLLVLLLFSFPFGTYGMEEEDSQEDSSSSSKVNLIFIDEESVTFKDEKENLNNSNNDTSEAPIVGFPQVHFREKIVDVIQKLIHDEKEEIRGALFQFTYYPIAKSMVNCLQKNIPISLVVDRGNVERKTKNSKKEDIPPCLPLNMIIKAGGKVYKKIRAKAKTKSMKTCTTNFLS